MYKILNLDHGKGRSAIRCQCGGGGMSVQTVAARDIVAGDVILAASPRYHGPDVRVTAVEHVHLGFSFIPPERRDSINFEVERMSGTPTRLTSVPMDKPYLVERADVDEVA